MFLYNLIEKFSKYLLVDRSSILFRDVDFLKVSGGEKYDELISSVLCKYRGQKTYNHLRRYGVKLIIKQGPGRSGVSLLVDYLLVYDSEIDDLGIDELFHSLVYRSFLKRIKKHGIYVNRNNRDRVRSIYWKFLT